MIVLEFSLYFIALLLREASFVQPFLVALNIFTSSFYVCLRNNGGLLNLWDD